MPFSNRIYRLAATVAKWHPALVILLSCSKVRVMHSHELVTVIYFPISSCVSPMAVFSIHAPQISYLSTALIASDSR
jgi:hypothetical protein